MFLSSNYSTTVLRLTETDLGFFPAGNKEMLCLRQLDNVWNGLVDIHLGHTRDYQRHIPKVVLVFISVKMSLKCPWLTHNVETCNQMSARCQLWCLLQKRNQSSSSHLPSTTAESNGQCYKSGVVLAHHNNAARTLSTWPWIYLLSLTIWITAVVNKPWKITLVCRINNLHVNNNGMNWL